MVKLTGTFQRNLSFVPQAESLHCVFVPGCHQPTNIRDMTWTMSGIKGSQNHLKHGPVLGCLVKNSWTGLVGAPGVEGQLSAGACILGGGHLVMLIGVRTGDAAIWTAQGNLRIYFCHRLPLAALATGYSTSKSRQLNAFQKQRLCTSKGKFGNIRGKLSPGADFVDWSFGSMGYLING
jgi:hypothetical protein